MPTYEYPIAATVGGITGVGVAGQVAFFNAVTNIVSDAGLLYDSGTDTLTVGSVLSLVERVGDPAAVANRGHVYTKDVAGVTQLFYRADDGTVNQLTPSVVTNAFVQGGNSFGATAILGTNDAFALEFETGGVSHFSLATTGDLTMLGDTDFVPAVDNTGELGTNALRWNRIRGTTIVSGDLELLDEKRNAHWVMREEPDRVTLTNVNTGKKYRVVLEEER